LKIWDADKNQEILTLKGHAGNVESVALSPDDKRIVSGGDTTVRVWDSERGQELLRAFGNNED
jgi:WD40 repeat protein